MEMEVCSFLPFFYYFLIIFFFYSLLVVLWELSINRAHVLLVIGY